MKSPELASGASTWPGTSLGLVAILLWGSTVAFGRSLTAALGPVRAAAAVYLLCGTLALAYLLVSPRRLVHALRLPRRYLLGCGSLFVLYAVCLYLALGLATGPERAIEVGLINYLWPAATVVLSVPLLGTRARWPLLPGAGLALVGIAVAMLPRESWSGPLHMASIRANAVPYALALVAAIAWALYSNLSRRWAPGSGAGAVPLFLVATAAAFAPLAALVPSTGATWTARTWLELAYLGVFPTFLGYAFWEVAMRQGRLVVVATASYFTPLIASAFAAFYLRALPGPGLWIGCLLVTAGAWICRVSTGDGQSGLSGAGKATGSRA